MIDTAQVREALDRIERKGQIGSGYMTAVKVIADAARVLFAQLEAGALIVVPDENGKWPKWVEECGAYVRWENHRISWAVKTVGEVLDFLKITQDALRDAMPDGET